MLTLRQAQESRIPNVLGVCPTSDEFTSYLNEAQDRLITRGHWQGTFQRIRICADESCITLPRQVASMSEISRCDFPMPIRNSWFEFLSNTDGILSGSNCRLSCPGENFIDRGWYPTFSDIQGANNRLRVFYTQASDINKRVLIRGYDGNNKWIRSQDNGQSIDGFYITLTDPFTNSDFDVSSITGVQKDETDGEVLLYSYSTQSGDEKLLGRYEPDETVASYRRYFMSGFENNTCCGCETTKSLIGLAKLNFIPVSHPNDYLFISCLPALKEMCQSIRFGEMDNPDAQAKSLIHERKAIKELNMQKTHNTPNDQIAIGMNPQGSAHLNRRLIGKMI